MTASDFNTPPEFLTLVRQLDPRGIGLDPCSNETSLVQALRTYTREDNGLTQSWRGHGLVFMNPPHSQPPNNIEPWMAKAFTEFSPTLRSATFDQLVALVPAKTDTGWFHNHAICADRACFLRGRLQFWQGGQPTGGHGKFANLVLYFGTRVERFEHIFSSKGLIV